MYCVDSKSLPSVPPPSHSARLRGSAPLAAEGSRRQPLPARLVHDQARVKAVARALALRLLAVLLGHARQWKVRRVWAPVCTYHTNKRGEIRLHLRLSHMAALGKRGGLCGAVSGLNGRQQRANVLAIRGDCVVEADLPEALLRDSGARTREISREIICRCSAGPQVRSSVRRRVSDRCLGLPRGLGGNSVAGVVVVAPQRRARGKHAACRVEEAGAARASHL